MKNLSIFILSVCITFCSLGTVAQDIQSKSLPINEPDYNKPKLFADLPDRVDFNPDNFLNLFDLQIGKPINIDISGEFSFSGLIVSKSDDSNSKSIVIRSTNRVGARLIFSKVTGDNNEIKYIGRIISMKHADSYEITSENNQYYFKKKGIYDLMTE